MHTVVSLWVSWHVDSSLERAVSTDEKLTPTSPFFLLSTLPSLPLLPSKVPGSKLLVSLLIVSLQLIQKLLHVRLLGLPAKLLGRPIEVTQPRALQVP